MLTDDEINELCKEIAEATLNDYAEETYEKMIDEMFSEYNAMLYASHSYDNDAIAYGVMK